MILALLVAAISAFLQDGHAEEIEEFDDFEEKALEYDAGEVEDKER